MAAKRAATAEFQPNVESRDWAVRDEESLR